jgi:bacterial/archaeal transporter family-2 protein
MKASWIIPLIILGGALQSAGAAMNGQLKNALVNPFLASAVSFAIITFFFAALFFILPHPLPTSASIAGMPWWAPVGGLVGALQVYMGLTQVNKVGAGLFMGVTVTSALVASLLIDHFGLLRMEMHPLSWLRGLGAALLVAGVVLIARF